MSRVVAPGPGDPAGPAGPVAPPGPSGPAPDSGVVIRPTRPAPSTNHIAPSGPALSLPTKLLAVGTGGGGMARGGVMPPLSSRDGEETPSPPPGRGAGRESDPPPGSVTSVNTPRGVTRPFSPAVTSV